MKKLLYSLVVLGLLTSCASHPGRVCGGRGGGRCVDNTHTSKTIHNKQIV